MNDEAIDDIYVNYNDSRVEQWDFAERLVAGTLEQEQLYIGNTPLVHIRHQSPLYPPHVTLIPL